MTARETKDSATTLDAGAGESATADYDLEANGDTAERDRASETNRETGGVRRIARCTVAVGVLPLFAMILAGGAGYIKYQVGTSHVEATARTESLEAANDGTIALLSYTPDSAQNVLPSATDRLAEPFRSEYTKLITEVVIPGAKQSQISAKASVPGIASMEVSQGHAVFLVFVDQEIVAGKDAPAITASTVRVTLIKDKDRWLISEFEPI